MSFKDIEKYIKGIGNRQHAYSSTLNRRGRGSFFMELLRNPYKYEMASPTEANLVTSKQINSKKHLPIIDLDFDHYYVASSSPTHAHLYLNKPISKPRWMVLQLALWLAGVQERGYALWSLRRGMNCVRMPGLRRSTYEK